MRIVAAYLGGVCVSAQLQQVAALLYVWEQSCVHDLQQRAGGSVALLTCSLAALFSHSGGALRGAYRIWLWMLAGRASSKSDQLRFLGARQDHMPPAMSNSTVAALIYCPLALLS